MITDDERRRVAERLREKLSEGSPYSVYESVCYALGKTEHEGNWDVIVRLADLIDPGDASHNCRDTAACDREALLALADKLDSLGLNGFSSGWSSSAVNVGSFARRIREACGEEAS